MKVMDGAYTLFSVASSKIIIFVQQNISKGYNFAKKGPSDFISAEWGTFIPKFIHKNFTLAKKGMAESGAFHLKGLNGFRAIGILAVVITHLCTFSGLFGLEALWPHVRDAQYTLIGDYGLTLFFVLSGFLITCILLQEKGKHAINIKNFYLRRILRIWPLYYLYIALCVLFYLIFEIDLNPLNLLFYLTLTGNFAFMGSPLPLLSHFWFIGVLWQFYLIWPWAVAKFQNKKLLKLTVLFVLVFYSIKVMFYFLQTEYPLATPAVSLMASNRFHLIAIGCIGAMLYHGNSKWIPWLTDMKAQVVCWLIMLLLALNLLHFSTKLADHELMAIVFLIVVFGQIKRGDKVLDNKVLRFMGKISYGIYVLHLLVMLLARRVFGKFEESSFVNYLLLFSFVIFGSIALAYLSYAFYEKRFIKLKAKFGKINDRA